ncbi:MAG: hypothetical protein LBH54_05290 [Clostridiales bacterium]|jgi:hypothetical protein|nr:hypothetical protein [Clostridiales bacterium]
MIVQNGVAEKSDRDEYLKKFCDDAIKAIKMYDKEISNNVNKRIVKDFYKDFWRGIGISSATEPVIKWIVFSKLCLKYKMWSECPCFYSDKKQLDLGIYLEDDYETPDIAIEMKWAGFSADHRLFSNRLEHMINDVTKMYKPKVHSNKYFMQFAFINKNAWHNIDEIIENVQNDFDNRTKSHQFRNGKLSFFTKRKFLPADVEHKDVYFVMLVWKITTK